MADDTDRTARDGADTVRDAMEAMQSIERRVTEASGIVLDLGQRSAMVGQIVDTISSIASETNLLALNAAIEAARAGEQGRGFAVVADEVRKLAEKSARSAGEIDAITGTISGQSQAVRSSLDKGIGHLSASREAAGNVAEVLKAAGASVAEVRDGLDRIAQATEEQRRATETVTGNIEAIAGMARQNDATVARTVTAAGEMQRLADRLQESVSRFKV